MELWNRITTILTTPFTGNLDIKHVFLLVGLVLVCIAAWIFILNHIRAAAMEVIE